MDKLTKLAIYVVLAVVGFWLNAETICLMWSWFVAPAFGLRAEMPLLLAVGLQAFTKYMVTGPRFSDYKARAENIEDAENFDLYVMVGYPLVILFGAWIVHICM